MTEEANKNEQHTFEGGDIKIQAGKGWRSPDGIKHSDGSIIFLLADGAEVLRIDPDGAFWVRGEKATHDSEIYAVAREFFCTVLAGPGESG